MKSKAKNRLKILYVAAEAAPFAKAGGVGDVLGSLPKSVAENFQLETRIMIPLYSITDLKKWQARLIIKDLRLSLFRKNKIKINVYKVVLPQSLIPVYLVDIPKVFSNDGIYGNTVKGEYSLPFVIFSKICLELTRAMDWAPDLIHVHDWVSAIIPKWLNTIYKDDSFFKKTATVLTIHNIMYQGKVGLDYLKDLGLKKPELKAVAKFTHHQHEVNMLAEGVLNADFVNTVSLTYSEELLTKKYGFGLEKLLLAKKHRFTGILNGINYQDFDPRTNGDTPHKYGSTSLELKAKNKLFLQKKLGLNQSKDVPLICAVTRLTNQKGLDLIEDVLKELVNMGGQFVILGTGDEKIEKIFIKAEKEYPKTVSAQIKFDVNFAQTIYAGSDMFLMPSRFEPCGLSQIIAMKFGTIPIVRKTGGLADTVRDNYTGFVFKEYNKQAFLKAIGRAVEMYYNQKGKWRSMQVKAMKKDFSWKKSAKKYFWLYKKAVKVHKSTLKENN